MTGIDVRRAYLIAFAIGTALAGAAGTLVSVGYSISPSIGLEWTLKALVVVVLAGLGSMLGTFVGDRKSTRLNSSHPSISYAVFCLKKKNTFPSTSLRLQLPIA